jgi:uncharacterized protein YdeI (BOF family)
MKNFIAILAVGFALSLGAWAYAGSGASGASGSAKGESVAGSEKAAAALAITGDVIRIEGENYVVKDSTGKEVKLHVSPKTKKDGDIKVGDKVEAQTDPSGHAISIKTTKVIGGSSGPTEAPR